MALPLRGPVRMSTHNNCSHNNLMHLGVLFSLMMAATTRANDSEASPICAVKPSFQAPYVIPYWEEKVTVHGCSSRSLAHRSQEVHVIYLKNDESPRSSRVPLVTLHVKPLAEHSVHAGRLVILLHAQRTVSWRVIGERLSNASHHTFVVTQGSQIIEHSNMRILVMRRTESTISRVLNWATKRFKAVTSFAEISEANNIYLKVGVSDTAPRECNVSTQLVSPNVEAVISETVPQSQRKGCIVDSALKKKDVPEVHVIQVQLVSHPSTDEQETTDQDKEGAPVVIDVRPRSTRTVDKNVILVLKAHQPVVWNVKSENMHGILKIVTEDQVERLRMGTSQMISVKNEELPENSDDLIFYADNKYGPLLSYLEVKAANKFRIVIDDEPAPNDMTTSAPTPLPSTRWPLSRRTNPTQSSKDLFKSHLSSIRTSKSSGAQVFVKSNGRVQKTDDYIALPNLLLIDAMQVDCLPEYIRISFPRMALERLGIGGRDMSLMDSACRVISNDTHFVLSTYFDGCGTEMERIQDRILYRNLVKFQLQNPRSFGSVLSQRNMDLLIDDEDQNENGSGLEDDRSVGERENYLNPKSLEFQCEYRSADMTLKNGNVAYVDQKSDVKSPHWQIYGLDLYRDIDYRTSIKAMDYPVNVIENERLYVESRIDAGPHLRVVTEECWLSNSANYTDENKTLLIRNTCPVDVNIQVERAGPSRSDIQAALGFGLMSSLRQWSHFSFQVNPEFVKLGTLYLHCMLGVCSINPQHKAGNLEKCVDPQQFCSSNNLHPFLDQRLGTHHEILTRGPIHIIPKHPVGNPYPKAPFMEAPKKVDREEKIVIQEPPQVIFIGLSTEAVVGIAFASFIIGAGLTAVLWFIHLRTDPLRNNRARAPHHSGYDLSAHSGSSTPSSQVPMTQ